MSSEVLNWTFSDNNNNNNIMELTSNFSWILEVVTKNKNKTGSDDGYDNPTDIHHQGQFSEPFKVLLHILYNLVLFCGVIGNGLVIYVIYSLPRMRSTTNILLSSLACGDLIIASFCVPFTYISILYGYWPFGGILCKVVSPFNAIGVLVSAFTLIALAIEKYVAILHPLAPRLRKSKVWWVVILIWIAACATSIPIAVVSEIYELPINGTNESVSFCQERGWGNAQQELYYSISLMMVQYFIPLGVLAFTYSRITFVVWGIQNERPSVVTGLNGNNNEINLNRNSRTDTRSRKTVLLTLAVVCGYTLAWLPYNINYIISRHNPEYTNEYISIACHWLAMSHSFYNPVIYAWINNSFKNAFKDVYRKIICCVKQQASSGISTRCRDRSSFSTTMSTVRWKSYRKISFTPEPNNAPMRKDGKDLSIINEET